MAPVSRVCPACSTSYSSEVSFCGHDGRITIQVQPPGEEDPRLGTQLGDFVVAARVADGAMGRVYEGRHPETRQQVAIKVLHPQVAQDPIAVERFRREFETAEEMEHPHIVRVLDFGETGNGSYFMTMEFLFGEELSQMMDREGKLNGARLVRVVSQVAQALDCAHSAGVIHRDLKPDNVFLCESDDGDVVKLLDFGSVKLQMEMGAKLTAFGTTIGTPYYMSPEQAMGKLDVDQRTDVFALAAITHQMATGAVPFKGDNVAKILMAIVQEEPPPSSQINMDLPPGFDAVIAKGLVKDKTLRYASAGQFADAIVTAFGLEGGHAQWAKTPLAETARALSVTAPHPVLVSSWPPVAKASATVAYGEGPGTGGADATVQDGGPFASNLGTAETVLADGPLVAEPIKTTSNKNLIGFVLLGVGAALLVIVAAILFFTLSR